MPRTVYNIIALRKVPGMARSEIVALWTGTAWTEDADQEKHYSSYDAAERALWRLKREGLDRAFNDVTVAESEYREPMERKRWYSPEEGMSGLSHQQILTLINEVRSAIANLDMEDRNPAIRAALTIGWRDEEAMREPKSKKRWGELAPGNAKEILEGMGDELLQNDPDDVSDVVKVANKVIDHGIEIVGETLPIPDHEILRELAIKDFKREHGREPKLGWWEDRLSTDNPA